MTDGGKIEDGDRDGLGWVKRMSDDKIKGSSVPAGSIIKLHQHFKHPAKLSVVNSANVANVNTKNYVRFAIEVIIGFYVDSLIYVEYFKKLRQVF